MNGKLSLEWPQAPFHERLQKFFHGYTFQVADEAM